MPRALVGLALALLPLAAAEPAARGGLHKGARLEEAKRMHDWWCTPERATTTPCFRHEHLQKMAVVCGTDNEHKDKTECKELKSGHAKAMEERRQADSLLPDQERYDMHDSWCGKLENAAGDFCQGWFEHKASEEAAKKAEL